MEEGGVAPTLRLEAVLDVPKCAASLQWRESGSGRECARGSVVINPECVIHFHAIVWTLEIDGKASSSTGGFDAASVHATLRRWKKLLPVADGDISIRLLESKGEVAARGDTWRELGTAIYQILKLERDVTIENARARWTGAFREGSSRTGSSPWRLECEMNEAGRFIALRWERSDGGDSAVIRVSVSGFDELTWLCECAGVREVRCTSHHRDAIAAELDRWMSPRPAPNSNVTARWVRMNRSTRHLEAVPEKPFQPGESVRMNLIEWVHEMAEQIRPEYSPLGRMIRDIEPERLIAMERAARRAQREAEKESEHAAERAEQMRQLAEKRRQRELERDQRKRERERAQAAAAMPKKPNAPRAEPTPPVPVQFDLEPFQLQEMAFVCANLRNFFLRERGALWWISNQSDDLLCLPHCRLERLDYQVRTALRVLGPLRGRALLSDEVGLGKTIEAGLVLKELFTRGMARRALVLTVPSLVDQWEEELADKFDLEAATTNSPAFRADSEAFWGGHRVIVASLHTLKQPAHLAIARQVRWDALVVDEAHYLRNRDSQAWQAVNVLPRQFLLLLSATPVQNSLEELYNLVTLLDPGRLPSPREFRARFIDPKRPRQPREPEELRRLLGQVMIRNTRANAGVNLPPRHAETVLFEPAPEEAAFWSEWETELRESIGGLPASQASLWGRLLLQAGGSSPAAWRKALEKFPLRKVAHGWLDRAPLEASWKKKCALLPPLARGEGGCVIFSQFLETQSALAASLRGEGVPVFVINGGTPPPERQPITEKFRKEGGALLLTHSGTEGRNLQFSRRLVNFDLPWNPMEIEQRIGRLHRLGQKHPVHIFNLVQRGTLQEHLLEILQEKLNLFELVVGETGLVLGERFSSDEFAEEVLRRWRESGGDVAGAFATLGAELAAARDAYDEVKQLDETLFAADFETT